MPSSSLLKYYNRIKYIEDDRCKVEREATPTLDLANNLVNVHYDVRLRYKNGQPDALLTEDHPMRYWFLPELRYLSGQAGFSVVDCGAWLGKCMPSDTDCAAWMLVEKTEF